MLDKLISNWTSKLMDVCDSAAFKRHDEEGKVGYALLWMLGVPVPVLLVLYLIFR